jgi:hypothetical protein
MHQLVHLRAIATTRTKPALAASIPLAHRLLNSRPPNNPPSSQRRINRCSKLQRDRGRLLQRRSTQGMIFLQVDAPTMHLPILAPLIPFEWEMWPPLCHRNLLRMNTISTALITILALLHPSPAKYLSLVRLQVDTLSSNRNRIRGPRVVALGRVSRIILLSRTLALIKGLRDKGSLPARKDMVRNLR